MIRSLAVISLLASIAPVYRLLKPRRYFRWSNESPAPTHRSTAT